MQTISGAIGFLAQSPVPSAAISPPGHPTFTLLQCGPAVEAPAAPPAGLVARVLNWLASPAQPDPPTTIGIITFDAAGRRTSWKVNGMACGQIELDCLRAYEQSGYPLEQLQRPNLARFVGKVASQITTVADVQTVLESPIQLPWTGEKVLRVTPLAGAEAAAGLPDEWRGLLATAGGSL